jgi:hypothetical protein
MFQNAFSLVTAGTETAGYALTTVIYHLLAESDRCRRFKRNFLWRVQMPSSTVSNLYTTLEKSPYLRVAIQESLRSVIGILGTIVQDQSPQANGVYGLGDPTHAAVSLSQRDIYGNAKFSLGPKNFDPKRWLKGEESWR